MNLYIVSFLFEPLYPCRDVLTRCFSQLAILLGSRRNFIPKRTARPAHAHIYTQKQTLHHLPTPVYNWGKLGDSNNEIEIKIKHAQDDQHAFNKMRPVTQCHMGPEPSSVPKPPHDACNGHLVREVTLVRYTEAESIQPMGLMRLHTVNKRYIYLLIYISHWSEDSLEPSLCTQKASGSSCEKLFDVRVTLCVIWRGEIAPHLRGFKEFCFWGSISFQFFKKHQEFCTFPCNVLVKI